mgnify:FL=1
MTKQKPGRPETPEWKKQFVRDIFVAHPEASAYKIYTLGKARHGKGNFPGQSKTAEIVQGLIDAGGVRQLDQDPAVAPWSEEWCESGLASTLLVLHNTAKDVAQKNFRYLTDRQIKWFSWLSDLFDLSKKREILLLLWFGIRYSEQERSVKKLGYMDLEPATYWLDRMVMEWTGRIEPRYPGDTIPNDTQLADDIFFYFKDITEGRESHWLIGRVRNAEPTDGVSDADRDEDEELEAGELGEQEDYDWLNIP